MADGASVVAPKQLLVSGAGTRQADGVYEPVAGVLHEGCPVFESLGGYHMSVTCRPEDGTGRMLWGWVIGRKLADGTGAMPVYACPTDVKTEIPEDEWQCFEGTEPAPEVRPLAAEDAEGQVEAYEQEAWTAAMTRDLRRASEAFARALRRAASSPALEADWRRRAELHAARGKVSLMRQKFDSALHDAEASLNMRPDFAPALLLRAQVLRETREVYDAALSAKQCLLFMRQDAEEEQEEAKKEEAAAGAGGGGGGAPAAKSRGGGRAARECERLLAELGERPDASVPGGKELGEDEFSEAPLQRILSVDVADCGSSECCGSYAPTGAESNGEPVLENSRGFRLSLELLPMKGTGDAKFGWVIGRGRQGYYGARCAPGATGQPPRDGWRSFGRGQPPLPRCRVQSAASSAPALDGLAALRRGSPAEAAELLRASLEAPGGPRRDLLGRAVALTDLASALREAGELEDARAAAREACSLWPSFDGALLEEARALEASGEDCLAVAALQRLLTMRPAHERAAAALLALAAREPTAREWLSHHQAIEALALEVSGQGSAEQPRRQDEEGQSTEERSRLEVQKQLELLRGRKEPHVFESKDSEVHACWTLPSRELGAADLRVELAVQHLAIWVRGVAIFDEDLAHKIKPSESSWAYTAPDLTMVLCKSTERGAWPKWDTLHRESLDEREARLAGLPVDQRQLLWT